MRKELPALPYGQGSMTWVTIKNKEYIQYRKNIGTIHKKRKVVYGDTVQEVLRLMKAEEKKYADEEAKTHYEQANPGNLLFQEAIHSWLTLTKKPVLKSRSYDTIESTFYTHIHNKPLGRSMISNVLPTDIQRALNDLNETHATSTVKKVYNLLSQFFAYYYATDISKNPMNRVIIPKKQVVFDANTEIIDTEEIEVLSDEEIKAFTDDLISHKISNAWLLIFIMWTYVRLGEVVAIQYKDIDFDSHKIKIYKSYERVKDRSGGSLKYKWELSTPKTKHGRRIIILCDNAYNALQEHLKVKNEWKPTDFIFVTPSGNPQTSQTLNKTLQASFKRCGIQKSVTVHGLRHTGISYFLRHGVDVKVISEMAGHSDVATTQRIYYNVLQEQKDAAYDELHDEETT